MSLALHGAERLTTYTKYFQYITKQVQINQSVKRGRLAGDLASYSDEAHRSGCIYARAAGA